MHYSTRQKYYETRQGDEDDDSEIEVIESPNDADVEKFIENIGSGENDSFSTTQENDSLKRKRERYLENIKNRKHEKVEHRKRERKPRKDKRIPKWVMRRIKMTGRLLDCITDASIPRSIFLRLSKEIANEVKTKKKELRISYDALSILQDAAEEIIATSFEEKEWMV